MSDKIRVKNQNDEQLVVMIRTLLLGHASGRILDGFSAAQMFMKDFGLYGDHHLFTEVMDYMSRIDEATCIQPWGTTLYQIRRSDK